jgi:hypothetical protein
VNPLIIGVYTTFINKNNLRYTQNKYVNYERPNVQNALNM